MCAGKKGVESKYHLLNYNISGGKISKYLLFLPNKDFPSNIMAIPSLPNYLRKIRIISKNVNIKKTMKYLDELFVISKNISVHEFLFEQQFLFLSTVQFFSNLSHVTLSLSKTSNVLHESSVLHINLI